MGRIVAIASLIAIGLCIPVSGQQFPEVPLYELLPDDFPYPIIRVCSTPEGICRVPFTVPPGRPCSCLRADGTWVNGVCIR